VHSYCCICCFHWQTRQFTASFEGFRGGVEISNSDLRVAVSSLDKPEHTNSSLWLTRTHVMEKKGNDVGGRARYVLHVETWRSAVRFTPSLLYAWRNNPDTRWIGDRGNGSWLWGGGEGPREDRNFSLPGIVRNYRFVWSADSMLTSSNDPVTQLTLFHHYLEWNCTPNESGHSDPHWKKHRYYKWQLFRPCDHVLNSDTPHFHWEQNIFGSENSYSNHTKLLEFTNEYIYCNFTTYNAQINVIIMPLKLCA
jgi:hypothetical protein